MGTREMAMRASGVLVFLVLLPGMVAGVPLLDVQLLVAKNDTVRLADARVYDRTPSDAPDLLRPGEYVLEILDRSNNTLYQKNFSITFFVIDYGPVDEVLLWREIPYTKDMWALRFSRGNKTLLFEELGLCNRDGTCSGRETIISCPEDCTGSEPDGVCIGDRDGVCDPDCGPGVDTDCLYYKREPNETITEKTNETQTTGTPSIESGDNSTAGEDSGSSVEPGLGEGSGFGWWVVVLVLVAVVVLGLSIKREGEQ